MKELHWFLNWMIPAVVVVVENVWRLESSRKASYERWCNVTVNNHDHFLNTCHVPVTVLHTCIGNAPSCLSSLYPIWEICSTYSSCWMVKWGLNMFYVLPSFRVQLFVPDPRLAPQPVCFITQPEKMRCAYQIAFLRIWTKRFREELPVSCG